MFHKMVFPSSSSFKRAKGQSPASMPEVNSQSPLATVLVPNDSPSQTQPGTPKRAAKAPLPLSASFLRGPGSPASPHLSLPALTVKQGLCFHHLPLSYRHQAQLRMEWPRKGAPSFLPHPSPQLLLAVPSHCPSLITRISSALLNPTPLLPNPPQMSHL